MSNRPFLFRLSFGITPQHFLWHRGRDKSLMISSYCGARDVEMRFPIPFISHADLRFYYCKVFTYRCCFNASILSLYWFVHAVKSAPTCWDTRLDAFYVVRQKGENVTLFKQHFLCPAEEIFDSEHVNFGTNTIPNVSRNHFVAWKNILTNLSSLPFDIACSFKKICLTFFIVTILIYI